MAKASKEYLTKAAEEQDLRSYVVEQLKESQVCLRQVVARIPELIAADKMLCQQLRDENRSQKEIEDFYKPLYQSSLQLRDRMAMFGINEVRTMDPVPIIWNGRTIVVHSLEPVPLLLSIVGS